MYYQILEKLFDTEGNLILKVNNRYLNFTVEDNSRVDNRLFMTFKSEFIDTVDFQHIEDEKNKNKMEVLEDDYKL